MRIFLSLRQRKLTNLLIGGSEYRYGHNGQEKEDEIFNGAYSAEYWEYDSRTLRRWNVDPVVKPWESPYATFNNNPVNLAGKISAKEAKKNNGK